MSQVIKEKKQPLVRLDFADKVILDQLSQKTGESAPKLLHRALTSLKKEIFFEQMNSAYSDIRENKEAWDVEAKERTLFESASADGLEP